MLIDTHVHLDCFLPGGEREEAAERARCAGVGGFVVPGVCRPGWFEVMRLTDTVAGVLAAPGLHPQAAGEWNQEAAAELRRHLSGARTVAVGEIGLDRLLPYPALAVQEEAFRGQLRLAAAAGLPVLLHCRRANGRLLAIVEEENFRFGGIWHAFSGSPETARAAVGRGFVIGFGGAVTYPEARRAPEVLRSLPADAIVLETDAPDLPPHPYRGEKNRPAWLPLIAARVAEIRGWTQEETARITTENARRVLKLRKDRPLSFLAG